MIKLIIDETAIEVTAGTTILEAARSIDKKIPTLCYNQHLKPYGGCRMCLVEVSSAGSKAPPRLVSSCTCPVEEGMIVVTVSERIQRARKFVLQLLIARSPESTELRELGQEYGIDLNNEPTMDQIGRYLFTRAPKPQYSKCITCGLCVRVCSEFVGMSATTFSYRGTKRKVTTPFQKVSETCIGCGACAYLCPTKAIRIEPAE